VVLAALAAGFISRRVLRPVRTASSAAAAMAAGDLSVRLPAESDDEFGQWAESFNTMAASLETKVAELQAAHEREQRFVADVSHELRTPLTALVAEAEMANSFLSTMPESAGRVGELLTTDTARLRRLVEDLLEISRLDAATSAADALDLDVLRFLEAVIADRHPSASLRATSARVRCDRRGLERIVGNLLDNAAQHAPGAAVAVEAGVVGSALHVVVADDGPGVPAASLDRLFERFYTTDAARQGGSGLGLAIAREHAQRMGGDLTVRANTPRGLVFDLRVPVTVLLPDGDRAEKEQSQAEGESSTSVRRTP
jgi:two-component system sensor histidine kinase MtrB